MGGLQIPKLFPLESTASELLTAGKAQGLEATASELLNAGKAQAQGLEEMLQGIPSGDLHIPEQLSLASTASELLTAGVALESTASEGLEATASGLLNAGKAQAQGVEGVFQGIPSLESTASELLNAGKAQAQGLGGVFQGIPSLESAASELLNAGKSQLLEGLLQGIGSNPLAFILQAGAFLWKLYPQLQQFFQRITSNIVSWMQKGSLWRTLLISAVGVVLLLGLAGLGMFTLFFLAATINAIAIASLGPIALVGASAAVFFAIVTIIYIGALVAAIVAIGTITFFCVCAALTGWIAFAWAVWQGLTKGAGLVKDLVTGLGSILKWPRVTSIGEGQYVSAAKDK